MVNSSSSHHSNCSKNLIFLNIIILSLALHRGTPLLPSALKTVLFPALPQGIYSFSQEDSSPLLPTPSSHNTVLAALNHFPSTFETFALSTPLFPLPLSRYLESRQYIPHPYLKPSLLPETKSALKLLRLSPMKSGLCFGLPTGILLPWGLCLSTTASPTPARVGR